jgi:DNA-binding transcriptional LysR family regulator
LKYPPVGPSAPSVARCTAIAAPWAAVREIGMPSVAVKSVAQPPGSAAFTRMPAVRSSFAYCTVRALSAVLDGKYAADERRLAWWVALTPAGEVLLHEGRKALEAVGAAARRTRRAGSADARLVLAMKPGGDGGLLPAILAAYENEPDAVAVEIVCGIAERAQMLRDGRADVGFLHRETHDLGGFDTEELLVEDQVVIVPRGHRLAERPAVAMADLNGETMPRWPERRRDGRPSASGLSGVLGPEVGEVGQLMQLIALGRTLAVVPESARGVARGDLTCVPVLDAPATTLLLAWPESSRSRALAAFVRVAAAVAAGARAGAG